MPSPRLVIVGAVHITQALAPMGAQAVVCDTIDKLVARVVAEARAGDHILCMSNGGFGGIHQKLLDALAARKA